MSLCCFSGIAYAGSFTAFGPEVFHRLNGSPVTEIRHFSLLNPGTTYTLQVFNGGLADDTYEKVSSSVITLNGIEAVGPSNFNQNVSLVEAGLFPEIDNELSVELRGKPGGAVTIYIIGEDNDLPSITASIDHAANMSGWHKNDVTVTFTCSDATSGIQSCPDPVTVTLEAAAQVISGTAIDYAGNSATASVEVSLDKTLPLLEGSISPLPNSNGWNNTDVTINFACSDLLSGIAFCSPPIPVAAEGGGQLFEGEATDVAGNNIKTTVLVNLDKSLPSLEILSPLEGAFTNSLTIDVSGTASDLYSQVEWLTVNGAAIPLSADSYSTSVALNEEGTNVITAIATDRAGNGIEKSKSVIRDTVSPVVAITSHVDGVYLNTPTISISGSINDLNTASVTVNGLSADFTDGAD
ncbi:MAG: hypothetical protein OEV42_19950, partial [Deltaproteobacteria bacterium]|nr:hypothetical protein [Deltaproteobacteria bacterium]